jgi:hypothetical protein
MNYGKFSRRFFKKNFPRKNNFQPNKNLYERAYTKEKYGSKLLEHMKSELTVLGFVAVIVYASRLAGAFEYGKLDHHRRQLGGEGKSFQATINAESSFENYNENSNFQTLDRHQWEYHNHYESDSRASARRLHEPSTESRSIRMFWYDAFPAQGLDLLHALEDVHIQVFVAMILYFVGMLVQVRFVCSHILQP